MLLLHQHRRGRFRAEIRPVAPSLSNVVGEELYVDGSPRTFGMRSGCDRERTRRARTSGAHTDGCETGHAMPTGRHGTSVSLNHWDNRDYLSGERGALLSVASYDLLHGQRSPVTDHPYPAVAGLQVGQSVTGHGA